MLNKEIANIKGFSPSYISKHVNGKVHNELTDDIIALFNVDTLDIIKDIFLDEETYKVCDVCIEKARNKRTIKHAVKIQQIRQILLRAEGKEDE